jgi:hypothetical protein
LRNKLTSTRQTNRYRETVFERDGEKCVVAGSRWGWQQPCGGALTIQHRVSRGTGGSASNEFPENYLTMCAVHNALDTSSADFRDFCLRSGYSVARWYVSPDIGVQESDHDRQDLIRSVPVRYSDGWHFLEGVNRVKVSDDDAVTIILAIYGE